MIEPDHLEAGSLEQLAQCRGREEEIVMARRQEVPAGARDTSDQRSGVAGREREYTALSQQRVGPLEVSARIEAVLDVSTSSPRRAIRRKRG